jgi:hypothetical protein
LKEIVVKVLERAKQKEQQEERGSSEEPQFSTSRMRYMVDAITDLKNNKSKPPATAELIPQMKRAQRTIVGKRGIFLFVSPFSPPLHPLFSEFEATTTKSRRRSLLN